MDPRGIQLLAILMFCFRKSTEDGELGCGFELSSGPLDCFWYEMVSPPWYLCISEVTWGAWKQITVKVGADALIKCKPAESSSSTIWFRVRDNAAMEFIATFNFKGESKRNSTSTTLQLDSSKITTDILKLKSFKKEDSGLYCCATYQNYLLVFGQVTELVAGELIPDLIRSLLSGAVLNTFLFSIKKQLWHRGPPRRLPPPPKKPSAQQLQRACVTRKVDAWKLVVLASQNTDWRHLLQSGGELSQGKESRASRWTAHRWSWAPWPAAAAFCCSSSS